MHRAIAVTGSSGRLGRILLERLAHDRAVERIVAIDRVPGDEHLASHCKLETCALDVRDPGLAAAFRGVDAVVHLAFVVERGSRDATETEAVNLGGTRNVARCALAAGAGQLVFASSIAAYGFEPDNAGQALTEDAPLRGERSDFYYARHKAVCDGWLAAFGDDHPELAIARLRPSMFLGPRGYGDDTFAHRFVPFLAGDGVDNPMHITHEDDVAEAFYLALARGVRGAYNIASEGPLTMRELARQIGRPAVPVPVAVLAVADAAWRAGVFDLDPMWLRAQARAPIVVSARAARRGLRWRPHYDTTAQVARALADRPAARASASVKLVLGGLCAFTRARGSLPATEHQRHGLAGLSGAANLALTGDRGSEWHVRFGNGAVGMYPGLAADAASTTSIAESDFLALIAGDLDWSRASMTGRVKVRGKADFGLVMGGVITGLYLQIARAADGSLPERVLSWVARAAMERDRGQNQARSRRPGESGGPRSGGNRDPQGRV